MLMTEETTPAPVIGESYTVDGYGGIAFVLKRYAQTWAPDMIVLEDQDDDGTPEWEEVESPDGSGEWIDNPDRVVLVMVGDDREHEVGTDEITLLPREDYCGECGQVGCTHDGLDRV